MFDKKLWISLLLLGAMSGAMACEINQQAIADVRLGMNIKQVKQKFPQAKITRTSDGEGLALIDIKLKPNLSLLAYADEEDANKPVNQNRKITWLATDSAVCKTKAGVYAGMKLAEVEKYYGNLREIVESEIEAREFAQFSRQPTWLNIQAESGAGIFPKNTNSDGAKRSKRYQKNATVVRLSISQ